MAKISFAEIDDNGIIVGVHSDDIPAGLLPSGYSTVEINVEDPSGLVGQAASLIEETKDKRAPLNQLPEEQSLRLQLKQLSIELDLMGRMAEDTTAKQAEFDTLKAQYEAL